MSLFGKKKKLLRSLRLPPGVSLTSREYRLYKQFKKEKPGWYARLANGSTKFLKVNPDEGTKKSLANAIGFTELKTTPTAVMSLMVTTMVLFVILGVGVFFVTSNLTYTIVTIAIGLLVGYYFLKYPEGLVKQLRVRASSQVILAILYMVVSMRMSPNLERALRFSAANVEGELAYDLRKLLWDIELGKYTSADHALSEYIEKWKPENEEFAESLRLIRDSQAQLYGAAERTLDEALNTILEGTKVRMKHYTEDLRLPVMVIHMMGIVLPVLGAIMAPLAAVFLSRLFSAELFIIGYDVVLPIIILWFINNTLKKRPITFSQIDTRDHPDIPPSGTFMIKRGNKRTAFPVLPIAIILLLLLVVLPTYFFMQNPQYLLPKPEQIEAGLEFPDETLLMSILIIVGISVSFAVYFLVSNFQGLRIQGEIEKTEGEFELALFQLGNKIKAGVPTELAIEKAITDMKDLEIAGLFKRTLRNIRELGMTLDQALFDKKYGAIRYYPSRLIKNIMYTIADTSKKGVSYTSDAMLTISKYLRNVRETQEYIREILSETVSSMKFQAYMLTPIITGLIVSMSEIITRVFLILIKRLSDVSLTSDTGGLANVFGDIRTAMAPSMFQLIVGVYLIEVIIILAIFLVKISHGENKFLKWTTAGKMLIIGIIMYLIVALVSRTMFVGLIEQALIGLIG